MRGEDVCNLTYTYEQITNVNTSALPPLGELSGSIPEYLSQDLTLIGYEVDVAGETEDLYVQKEYDSKWTDEEHKAFETEIAARSES